MHIHATIGNESKSSWLTGIFNALHHTVIALVESYRSDLCFTVHEFQVSSTAIFAACNEDERVTAREDINLIAGLEEVLSCVVSVNSIDETKLLNYLAGYDSAFLYQKIGFIFSEYQTELGISDDFIKICNDRSGNSKRYLTNGICEPGYSSEWKLVYPKNIKRMKNGG